MDDPQVLDKDGVSAALRAAELMAFLDSNGFTLSQKLKEIYLKYGYHYNINSYFIINDNQITTKIFKRLRNFEGSPNTVSILMRGSCHLDRASNSKFSVEFWILIIVIFLTTVEFCRAPSRKQSYLLSWGTLIRVSCPFFTTDFHVGWTKQTFKIQQ